MISVGDDGKTTAKQSTTKLWSIFDGTYYDMGKHESIGAQASGVNPYRDQMGLNRTKMGMGD